MIKKLVGLLVGFIKPPCVQECLVLHINDIKKSNFFKNVLWIFHVFQARYHLNNSKLHPNRKGSGILASNCLKFFKHNDL